MNDARNRYQPRGKRKSKLPFVLVGIVIAVGAAGFLVLRNKPEKVLPARAADADGGPAAPGDPSEPESPKWLVVGAPQEVRSRVSVPGSSTAVVLPKDRPYEIVVPKDEKAVWVRGKACDYSGLKRQLLLTADMARDMGHSQRPSRMSVAIRADAGARFRMIQWVMQACADPAVRIYRIHWAVTDGKGGEATLPMFLPIDGKILSDAEIQSKVDVLEPDMLIEDTTPPIEEIEPIEMDDMPIEEEVIEDPMIRDEIDDEPFDETRPFRPDAEKRITERLVIGIRLRRTAGESATRVMFLDMSLGAGKFDVLARQLEQVGRQAPKTPCRIDASAEVPFGDVVKAVDAARAAGFREITFTGAPMPGR